MSWRKLSEDWKDQKSFVLFGFGSTAEVYIDQLMERIKIDCIIDNSTAEMDKRYKGISIKKYDDVKKQ